MFDAKVGIRRYKFKNNLEWQLAMTVYDAVNDLCDAEIEDVQMMFEDALEQQGVEIIYAAQ
jgi:hypothetical protein